eukprot:c19828_g1_i4.p1 GENE.c19828_g1_i4~~c19828_g1_i4.p1  ORF type:complete len:597 (+),score=85.56 c19828_g1_i4:1348-3138(+)
MTPVVAPPGTSWANSANTDTTRIGLDRLRESTAMPPRKKRATPKKKAPNKRKAKSDPESDHDVEIEEPEEEEGGVKRKLDDLEETPEEGTAKAPKLDETHAHEHHATSAEEAHAPEKEVEHHSPSSDRFTHPSEEPSADNHEQSKPEEVVEIHQQPQPEEMPGELPASAEVADGDNRHQEEPHDQLHALDHAAPSDIQASEQPEQAHDENFQHDQHDQNNQQNQHDYNHHPEQVDEQSGHGYSAEEITSTIPIDIRDVGKIIGREGEVLRNIELQSGAKITVDTTDDGTELRKVQIVGPNYAVERALQVVKDVISQPTHQSNGGGAAGGGGGGPLTSSFTLGLDMVGKVIGRGGENIKALQALTGTRIQIEAEGRAVITGHEEACEHAKQILQQINDGGDINTLLNRVGGVAAFRPPYAQPNPALYPRPAREGFRGFGAQGPTAGYYQYTPPYVQQQWAQQYSAAQGQYGQGQYPASPYGVAYGNQGHYGQHAAYYQQGAQPAHGAAAQSAQAGQHPAAVAQSHLHQQAQQQVPRTTQSTYAAAPTTLAPKPQAAAAAETPTWRAVQDSQGRVYYWNQRTNVTQWEKPPAELVFHS